MNTFETFRSALLILCGDPEGRRYDDALITSAILHALREYDTFFPRAQEQKSAFELIGSQLIRAEIHLTESQIISAVRITLASGKTICPAFHPAFQWERTEGGTLISLDKPLSLSASGSSLLLIIQQPHTLAGLAGAADAAQTSVPEHDLPLLAEGAAAFAMQLRAAAVTEIFGKRPDDLSALLRQSALLTARFQKTLASLSLSRGNQPMGVFPQKGFPI